MKKLKAIQISVILGLLVLAGVFTSARTIEAEPVYAGPVLLNGKTLHSPLLWLNSNGQLSLVTSHAETGEPSGVPFRVYLKRGNMVISRAASNADGMEISTILRQATLGDELVVEPVDEKLSTARRVFSVGRYPAFNWIPTLNGPRDGC